jgi:hypothetical protein
MPFGPSGRAARGPGNLFGKEEPAGGDTAAVGLGDAIGGDVEPESGELVTVSLGEADVAGAELQDVRARSIASVAPRNLAIAARYSRF